jgi:hypothetical protein
VRRRLLVLLPLLLLAGATPGCSSAPIATAGCTAEQRVAIVAQSVTTAAYVPCLTPLPVGWRVTRFEVRKGHTVFGLLSDRAGGRAVEVQLQGSCQVSGATPVQPRADGVRTYSRLRTIRPRYAGTLYDVFPGGCVTTRFDFQRGPHIALMEDLGRAVELVPRRQLRLDLRRDLGVELDP